MENEKKVKISPVGAAVYPHLSRPNVKFNPEGIYCVELALDKSPENEKFILELTKETRDKYPQGRLPYKKQLNDVEQPTGKILVTFKSTYQPKLFDKFGKKIGDDIIIGSGSVIQVAFIPNLYEIAKGNCGMNLYLQAVLVKELKEYRGRDAADYGFETEIQPEIESDILFGGDEKEEAPF